MGVLSLAVCCLLLTSASAATIPSATVDVSLSGDFSGPGPLGESCNLPDVIQIALSVGGAIVSLEVSKTKRVTQNAPVYVIGDDGQVRPVANEDKETYALYQDLNTGSAVMVSCPTPGSQDQKPTVEGTVTNEGRQFHLRHSSRRRRDVGSVTSEGDEYLLSAVPEDPIKGGTIDYLIPPEVDGLPTQPSTSSPGQGQTEGTLDDIVRNRLRRQATAMQNVYIDTTVVIAYDIYESYYNSSEGTTVEQKKTNTLERIKRHFALVMSEVDMHFGMIGSRLPYKISIGLASFVIAQSAAASKWTEEHKRVSSGSNRYLVNAGTMLHALNFWISNTTSLPPMDYYLLFTGYDLTNGDYDTGNVGLTYVRGVCASTESVTNGPGQNSAVVEDHNHLTSTVFIAVHEIAHGLGALHDSENNDCLASDSYVMTPVMPGNGAANYGIFSPCSLSYFNSTFSLLSTSPQSESCIHKITSPAGVPNVTDLVPGQVYDVQTQCKRVYGNESSVCPSLTPIGNSMCTITYCSLSERPGVCFGISPFRGTTCGDKKWCVNTLCVSSAAAGGMDETCPFGDQQKQPYSNVDRTCAEYAREEPSSCYNDYIRGICCKACNDVKRQEDIACPYGDKVNTCTASSCDTESMWDTCCFTCSAFRTTTATTTEATTTTTTPRTTTTTRTTTPTTTTRTTTPTTTTRTTTPTTTTRTTTPTTTTRTTTPTTTIPTTTIPTTTPTTTTRTTTPATTTRTTTPTTTTRTTTPTTTTRTTTPTTTTRTTTPTTTTRTTTPTTATQTTTCNALLRLFFVNAC